VASNHASLIDGFLVGIYTTRILNRHLQVLTLKAGWALSTLTISCLGEGSSPGRKDAR
jgi:hypothetical protein